jgi:heme iron utilization protein
MSSSPIRRHKPPPSSTPSSASSKQDLLYDPDIPSLSHAERARTLAEQAPDATLCTLDRDGVPYGSLVVYAVHAVSGDAVLLISEMAEHTKNLRADARCSLLIAEPGGGNPLARGRVTLTGRAEIVDTPGTDYRDAFLRKNPTALRYADFGDFSVWRIEVAGVRYIGGFGRMSWVGLDSWKTARADALALDADKLVRTLNSSETRKCGSLAAVAQASSFAREVSCATVTGVDMYGLEFAAETEHGLRPIRVAFRRPACGAGDADVLISDLEESVAS